MCVCVCVCVCVFVCNPACVCVLYGREYTCHELKISKYLQNHLFDWTEFIRPNLCVCVWVCVGVCVTVWMCVCVCSLLTCRSGTSCCGCTCGHSSPWRRCSSPGRPGGSRDTGGPCRHSSGTSGGSPASPSPFSLDRGAERTVKRQQAWSTQFPATLRILHAVKLQVVAILHRWCNSDVYCIGLFVFLWWSDLCLSTVF